MKNYEKLHDLLASGKWREADEETRRCMLKVAKLEDWDAGEYERMDRFPCEDLHTIDRLWVKYSRGKFGYSLQKQIYLSLGGTRKCDEKIWAAFGDYSRMASRRKMVEIP
ncbi:MAG: GUN4 domain-containing protein [Cyanobacteria bacterium P01_H01_bin.35]